MPNTLFLLEYDGSAFQGFQRQKNQQTVQGVLEHSIQIILGEDVFVDSAGRTDTGVHARGLPAGFFHGAKISNYRKFMHSMNALSGGKVSILNSCEMPDEFHPRFSCMAREYEFLFYSSPYPSPLWSGRAVHIRWDLDFEKMKKALGMLVGEFDFSSFSKKSSLPGKNPVTTIQEVSLNESQEYQGLWKLRVKGTAFLHNMIRILAGTLIDIGKGRWDCSFIMDILSKKDRIHAGKTLPPHGLYFLKGHYPDYPEIEDQYKKIFLI